MNLFLSKDNPWSHWSVERLLTELLDLRRSGWDGIGYMMAGKDQPERLFFVAGEDAFAEVSLLRAALEQHRQGDRLPFFRFYLSHEPTAPTVKHELCRVSHNGSIVIAELVPHLDVPDFFRQMMEGEHGDYLRHRARQGCKQVLSKIGDFPSGHHDVTSTGGLHGAFSQGGTL